MSSGRPLSTGITQSEFVIRTPGCPGGFEYVFVLHAIHRPSGDHETVMFVGAANARRIRGEACGRLTSNTASRPALSTARTLPPGDHGEPPAGQKGRCHRSVASRSKRACLPPAAAGRCADGPGGGLPARAPAVLAERTQYAIARTLRLLITPLRPNRTLPSVGRGPIRSCRYHRSNSRRLGSFVPSRRRFRKCSRRGGRRQRACGAAPASGESGVYPRNPPASASSDRVGDASSLRCIAASCVLAVACALGACDQSSGPACPISTKGAQ
jgi:hypothetical protein